MRFIAFLGLIVMSACASTAPTNYELNRRSGLGIDQDREDFDAGEAVKKDMAYLRTGTGLGKGALMPARLPAVVVKVWVYDQIINENQWLQGTWLFLEVDGEKWLPEVDSGSGGLLKSLDKNQGPKI